MKDRKTTPLWQTNPKNEDSKNWAQKSQKDSNPKKEKTQRTNAKQAGPQKPCETPPQNRLILPDLTAIGLGLSHASCTSQATLRRSALLSNTLSIYPQDGHNLGKLRIIPDREHGLERCVLQKIPAACSLASPEDETAAD
jgi:hypothetical protein